MGRNRALILKKLQGKAFGVFPYTAVYKKPDVDSYGNKVKQLKFIFDNNSRAFFLIRENTIGGEHSLIIKRLDNGSERNTTLPKGSKMFAKRREGVSHTTYFISSHVLEYRNGYLHDLKSDNKRYDFSFLKSEIFEEDDDRIISEFVVHSMHHVGLWIQDTGKPNPEHAPKYENVKTSPLLQSVT